MRKLLLLLGTLLIISCKEEPPEPETVDFRPVVVRWTGDYRVDGCGFFVEIDSVSYRPLNEDYFSDAFRMVSDTIVEMNYLNLNQEITSQCGQGFPFKIGGIEVMAIR